MLEGHGLSAPLFLVLPCTLVSFLDPLLATGLAQRVPDRLNQVTHTRRNATSLNCGELPPQLQSHPCSRTSAVNPFRGTCRQLFQHSILLHKRNHVVSTDLLKRQTGGVGTSFQYVIVRLCACGIGCPKPMLRAQRVGLHTYHSASLDQMEDYSHSENTYASLRQPCILLTRDGLRNL